MRLFKKLQVEKYLFKSVLVLIFIYSILSSFQLRWVSDDAFISFRYAKNFVNGMGLVFNKGERVEGYTNFLWTILLAIPQYYLFDPVIFSEIVGILFFSGILFCLIWFSVKIKQENVFFFPLAFMGFSVNRSAQIFATSGLETSLFTFLNLLGILVLFFSKKLTVSVLGFFLLVLSVMTRPDGAIFYAVGFFFFCYRVFWQIESKDVSVFQKFVNVFISQLPLFVIFLPYWTIKFIYYDSFFPNTFYAKSANVSYFSQGVKYFLLYFNSYYVYDFVPVLLLCIFIQRKAEIFKTPEKIKQVRESIDNQLIVLSLALVILYSFYVVKVGGDFMFARFFIPIVPFLYILLELLIFKISFRMKWLRVGLGCIVVIFTILYKNPYLGKKIPLIDNISNESEIYKRESVEKLRKRLLSWHSLFVENKISIAFGGSQAMFAYYLESPLAIEAETGLTDRYIARQTLGDRGRIGHEKNAPVSYLQERKIHLHLNPPESLISKKYKTVKIRDFPGHWVVITEDKNILEKMSKTGEFYIQ